MLTAVQPQSSAAQSKSGSISQLPIGQLLKSVMPGLPDVTVAVIQYPNSSGLQQAISSCGNLIMYVPPASVEAVPRAFSSCAYYRRLTADEQLAETGLLTDRVSLDWITRQAGMLEGVNQVLRIERSQIQ